jgi:excisionase family DNA binding protein
MVSIDPQERYWTAREVAARWGLSLRNIRRMIARGDLQVVRIGRAIRISGDALRAAEAVFSKQHERRRRGL